MKIEPRPARDPKWSLSNKIFTGGLGVIFTGLGVIFTGGLGVVFTASHVCDRLESSSLQLSTATRDLLAEMTINLQYST